MIQIGIGEKNARDRAVAHRVAPRLQLPTAFYLSRQVRRSVDQEPPSIVAADGNARLRLRRNLSVARGDAVRAGTIPLRQAAAGRAPENTDANRFTPARSDRARVTRALEKDRHVFHCRFNPFFLGAFHPGPPLYRQPWELAIILYLLSSRISGHAGAQASSSPQDESVQCVGLWGKRASSPASLAKAR
jgi:hypothetical protein